MNKLFNHPLTLIALSLYPRSTFSLTLSLSHSLSLCLSLSVSLSLSLSLSHSLTFFSFLSFFLSTGPGPALGEFGGEGAEGLKSKKNKVSSDDSDLLGEDVKPRAKLPPLLTPLGDLKSEKLHWLGVSFGLTSQLLNFWSRKLFKVFFITFLGSCNFIVD